MNTYPFPNVDLLNMTIIDGTFTKCPSFCKQKSQLRPQCLSYYKSIKNKTGPQQCPYGFSSYIHKAGSQHTIYTGIRIYAYYNRKETKHRIGVDHVPLLAVESMKEIATGHSAQLEEFNKLKIQSKRDQKFISSTLHEIRALNGEIIAQASLLKKALDEEQELEKLLYLQKNIYVKSFLISIRLNAYDFLANPDLITNAGTADISVHGKFLKASHSLSSKSWEQRDLIHFDGDCHVKLKGYKMFDILPFVLLDNALKFSPPDKDIYVNFFEKRPDLSVTVISEGPPLEIGEKEKIFEESYRGVNVSNNTSGSGLGLYVAKQICGFHNIEISATSNKQLRDQAQFILTLEFDPETLIW